MKYICCVSLFLLCLQFTEAVVNLKFDEEPKYEAYMKLFEPLCGPAPSRPILVEGSAKVGTTVQCYLEDASQQLFKQVPTTWMARVIASCGYPSILRSAGGPEAPTRRR